MSNIYWSGEKLCHSVTFFGVLVLTPWVALRWVRCLSDGCGSRSLISLLFLCLAHNWILRCYTPHVLHVLQTGRAGLSYCYRRGMRSILLQGWTHTGLWQSTKSSLDWIASCHLGRFSNGFCDKSPDCQCLLSGRCLLFTSPAHIGMRYHSCHRISRGTCYCISL